METQNKKSSLLLIFIIFLTSFLLGFLTSKNIYISSYLTSLEESDENIVDKIGNSLLKKDLDISNFWKVYNIVNTNFYGIDSVDESESQYGLIKGYIDSLGDKFSEYFTPEEYDDFNSTLSGDFEGIGAVIVTNVLGIEIDSLVKGSPALEGGLLKGDIIIEANGVELKDLSLSEAVNNIKGPAGTDVELKILRAGESDFLYKTITRAKIQIPSVTDELFEEDGIGYISLNIFGEHTSLEFEEALEKYKDNENVNGIIIDLRDNGGGYLESAVEILSNFIEKNKILVTTKYNNSLLNKSYPSINVGGVFDKKIVVLINGNSASASEITAGALSDYNKAILVGEKSYGKGSVQEPFIFSDGSMLKLTIAKWYTPNDYSIDKNGIEPDIKVSFEKSDYTPEVGKEDEFEFYDRQLETAKEVLKSYIELDNIGLVKAKYETSEITGTGTTN